MITPEYVISDWQLSLSESIIMFPIRRQFWLTSVATFSLLIPASFQAQAADVTVDGAVSTTQVLNGDDVLTVTESGSVTPAAGNDAIQGSGANNSIVINGSVTTSGAGAYGLRNTGATNSSVNNGGTISTSGNNAYGIHNGNNSDNVTITNSGTITTSGQNARGINSNNSSDVSIVNDGTIRTSASGATAIWADGNGNNVTVVNNGSLITFSSGINYNVTGTGGAVTNHGTIQTSGNSAPAVNVGTGVPITNTGTIITNGNFSAGINFFGSGATISNSGTITTNGQASSAIYANQNSTITNTGTLRSNGTSAMTAQFLSGNVFTNSGSIVSAKFRSISLAGTGNTINLRAPSYLGGAISLNTANSVNITTGASHSVLWDFSDGTMTGGNPTISGQVPWFYDSTTKKFATFDPTAFAARFNQLGDLAGMLSRLGQFGLSHSVRAGAGGETESALSAYADTDATAEDAAFAAQPGLVSAKELEAGRFWATAFGSYMDHAGNDTLLDQDIIQTGAALGYSWQPYADMNLSVMAGYVRGSVEAKSPFAKSQDIESNGVFAGVHAEQSFDAMSLGFGLSAGWQSHDSSRFVNDNLATTGGLTLGESYANASYDSWFITPEISFAYDQALAGDMVLTPKARVRYAFQSVDGYSENGSNANASVKAHKQGLWEGNLELALSKQFETAKVTGRLGYLMRNAAGSDSTSVTMMGITNAIATDAPNLSAAYIGLGADIALSDQINVALDGQAVFSDDVIGIGTMARLNWRF